ncbi:MAG: class I SAM-dependent methyltransferase [Christensenellales bacterium]|jgi:ubiquinone/menaquinone biosynthesis C-methylase UbiE
MAKITLKKEINGSILDLGGGGEGIIGRVYGSAVTAIDNRQEELDEAPKGPRKLLMDACDLQFEDASFDNVTAFFFLMYLPKECREKALSEAFRVLREKGRLFVWDAEIKEENPFVIELDIDANGELVHTAYGVVKDDTAQDAHSITRAAQAAGFRSVYGIVESGRFFLCFEKPAKG